MRLNQVEPIRQAIFGGRLALAAVVLLSGDGDVDSGPRLDHVESSGVQQCHSERIRCQRHARTTSEVEGEICHAVDNCDSCE